MLKVPKVPRGEKICVRYHDLKSNLVFILTSKGIPCDYILYEVTGNVLHKLGKASSPIELEEKYHVDERLRSTKK